MTDHEKDVVAALGESRAVRAIDRCIDAMHVLSASSIAIGGMRQLRDRMASASSGVRNVQVGLMLIAAVLTHVVLAWTAQTTAGWLGWLVPATVLLAGLLMVAAGLSAARRKNQINA